MRPIWSKNAVLGTFHDENICHKNLGNLTTFPDAKTSIVQCFPSTTLEGAGVTIVFGSSWDRERGASVYSVVPG